MLPDTNPLKADDYGLTDPAILEVALRVAPILFMALRIAHTLDNSHYPIDSSQKIEKALHTIMGDGDEFALAGHRITKNAAKHQFPNEFLPIVDKYDLIRKVYLAIVISHQNSARSEWEAIKTGKKKIDASHPTPTEVF